MKVNKFFIRVGHEPILGFFMKNLLSSFSDGYGRTERRQYASTWLTEAFS